MFHSVPITHEVPVHVESENYVVASELDLAGRFLRNLCDPVIEAFILLPEVSSLRFVKIQALTVNITVIPDVTFDLVVRPEPFDYFDPCSHYYGRRIHSRGHNHFKKTLIRVMPSSESFCNRRPQSSIMKYTDAWSYVPSIELNILQPIFGEWLNTTADKFRIKTFPWLSSVCKLALPKDRLFTLTNQYPRVKLSGALHQELHATTENILPISGRAEATENLIRDLGESGSSVLSQDGSTNISNLLSVSFLSRLASNSRPADTKAKKQLTRLQLPGSENQKPGATQYLQIEPRQILLSSRIVLIWSTTFLFQI